MIIGDMAVHVESVRSVFRAEIRTVRHDSVMMLPGLVLNYFSGESEPVVFPCVDDRDEALTRLDEAMNRVEQMGGFGLN